MIKWWEHVLYGIVSIFEGIVIAITVGKCYPGWTFSFVAWRNIVNMKRRM